MVDRNRPARYTVGDRAALKATGQPVQILEARRGEFVPDFVYKVRVLAEKPARPYNLSVPEHDLSDLSGLTARSGPWPRLSATLRLRLAFS